MLYNRNNENLAQWQVNTRNYRTTWGKQGNINDLFEYLVIHNEKIRIYLKNLPWMAELRALSPFQEGIMVDHVRGQALTGLALKYFKFFGFYSIPALCYSARQGTKSLFHYHPSKVLLIVIHLFTAPNPGRHTRNLRHNIQNCFSGQSQWQFSTNGY